MIEPPTESILSDRFKQSFTKEQNINSINFHYSLKKILSFHINGNKFYTSIVLKMNESPVAIRMSETRLLRLTRFCIQPIIVLRQTRFRFAAVLRMCDNYRLQNANWFQYVCHYATSPTLVAINYRDGNYLAASFRCARNRRDCALLLIVCAILLWINQVSIQQ